MIQVQLPGVRVQFSASLAALETYARHHFADDAPGHEATPEIVSHVEWIEGAPPRVAYGMPAPGTVRLDRDIAVGPGEVTWTRIDDFLDLRLRCVLQDERLHIRGQYFFSFGRSVLRHRLRKLRHARRLPALRAKRFSTILYYMVYYPAFWWLERHGMFPLHAAAVELQEGSVVLCGLPGCGKSTLSLALLSLQQARLVSDNIILYDGEQVWRCPEPLLVDDRSLGLSGGQAAWLRSGGRRRSFARDGYHVGPQRLVTQTSPHLFVFVRLGQTSELRRLSSHDACARFSAANWLAQEVRRHLVYRQVLALAYGIPASPCLTAEATLAALLSRGPCYELTVGWGEEACQAAVQHIRELLVAGDA